MSDIVADGIGEQPPLPSLAGILEALQADPLFLEQGIDTNETAVLSGYAPATLATLRNKGGGPPFLKLGKIVRYRRRDVINWMAARRRISTSDPGPEPPRVPAADSVDDSPPEHAPVGHNQPADETRPGARRSAGRKPEPEPGRAG